MADKCCENESMRERAARGTERQEEQRRTDRSLEIRERQEEGQVNREEQEEAQILEDLSEEKIRRLEDRRRGRVQSKMDETPVGAEVEEVKTPQSQKAKTKEEKSKKNTSRKTPELVRDTPR